MTEGCSHCKWEGPNGLCATHRGTMDPFPGTDAEMFIQWKGTVVCMDFHCQCGEHCHYDGDFAYYVMCPECESIYEMGTQVKARRLDPEAKPPKFMSSVKVMDGDDDF